MSRHALKFFKFRDGLKRESITSTFLLESQKGIHTKHLPAFLWKGREGLKLRAQLEQQLKKRRLNLLL